LQAANSISTAAKISLAIFISAVDISFGFDGTQQNAFPFAPYHHTRHLHGAAANDLMTHQTIPQMKSAPPRS